MEQHLGARSICILDSGELARLPKEAPAVFPATQSRHRVASQVIEWCAIRDTGGRRNSPYPG